MFSNLSLSPSFIVIAWIALVIPGLYQSMGLGYPDHPATHINNDNPAQIQLSYRRPPAGLMLPHPPRAPRSSAQAALNPLY